MRTQTMGSHAGARKDTENERVRESEKERETGAERQQRTQTGRRSQAEGRTGRETDSRKITDRWAGRKPAMEEDTYTDRRTGS